MPAPGLFSTHFLRKKSSVHKKATDKMSETVRLKIVQWIDYALMTIIGFTCAKYVFFGGHPFAEQHIQFRFIKFPIFVGEFVLAGCLILFAVKVSLSRIRINRWHWLIAFYFFFVVIKALKGFVQWGPLAFRDAALFYYLAFGVIVYFAYRPDYFNRLILWICYSLLIWAFFVKPFNEFWFLGRILLGLIIAYKYPERWVGVCMAAGILLLSPYQFFIENTRMIILGNFVAVSFLALSSAVFINPKFRKNVAIASILSVFLLAIYIFNFAAYRPARTIFKFHKTSVFFNELDERIQAQKPHFKMMTIRQTQLYSPDGSEETPLNELMKVQQSTESETHNAEASATSSPVIPTVTKPAPVQEVAVVTPEVSQVRDAASWESAKIGNSVFRLLIWRDMVDALKSERPLLGFDFGKPFRSVSLEIIHAGMSDWLRDGWVAAHNSYLNIIYRSGIFGVVFIIIFWALFVYIVRIFIRLKSVVGFLLCGVLLVWFVAAHFMIILEVPYTAVPIWTLYGLTLAYAHDQLRKAKNAHLNRP
jgi:hypothetical protein